MEPNYQACEQYFFVFFMDVYSGGRVWGSAQFSRTQGVFFYLLKEGRQQGQI